MKKHPYTPGYIYNVCYYTKTIVGDYKAGCSDYRAAGYNSHWIYCPYCGCPIHILDRKVTTND